MLSLFVRIAITLVLMLAGMHAAAGDVGVKKLHGTTWIQLETENFSLITDAGEKQASQMAEELERFRYFMAMLLGYEQYPLNNKVPIVLAKNKSSFNALGFSSNFAGVFIQNSGHYVIFAQADGFKSSAQGKGNWGRAVVLHELVHLLINNSTLPFATPFWYQEGIAEYFGTYLERRGQIVLGDMSVLGDRFFDMLKPGGGQFVDIDSQSLFKATQSDFIIRDVMNNRQNRELGRFYARSVAVVHYLNADSERRKKLYVYLTLLKRGYDQDEVFAHVFDTSYAEFDKEVHDYIFSRYVMGRTFPIGGNGGIAFPTITHTQKPLEKRQALEMLYSKITLLPESFLSNDSREKMFSDIEKIYPDFFVN